MRDNIMHMGDRTGSVMNGKGLSPSPEHLPYAPPYYFSKNLVNKLINETNVSNENQLNSPTNDKMIKNAIDKFIGHYCKIVTKNPDQERANVITGFIMDIDRDTGKVKIESKEGHKTVDIKTIVAIKPK